MITVDIKPMSVNEAWKGKRFKTSAYNKYQRDVMYLLPKIKIPEPPFKVIYKFGFSSRASDIDNPIKPFQDILQKKYGFDDKDIHVMEVHKELVKKGCEYVSFEILSLIE